jgi:hypothetical protein
MEAILLFTRQVRGGLFRELVNLNEIEPDSNLLRTATKT